MLKHRLIHPKINEVIGRGHHAKILIADGNYPASSKKGRCRARQHEPDAGVVSCTQVLEAVLSATVPIEAVNTMVCTRRPAYKNRRKLPPVWNEYRDMLQSLGVKLTLEPIDKWGFYEAVATDDHVLTTIQTADQQRFANVLLTIGVRMD